MLALAAALAVAPSCSAPDDPGEPMAARPGAETGTINVLYVYTEDHADLADSLAGSGIFEGMAEAVASVVALPADIEAVFTECGEPNAFYVDRKVVMCYEFLDLFIQVFVELSDDPREIQAQVFGTAAFFYLHEIGHALVDQLQIPITGREEDSVDTLATLILLQGGSESALLSAITHFEAMASAAASQGYFPFWDEHSMDSQRLYDVACMIYGSDPEAWGHIVAPELLPIERAERCPYEYQQKSLAWDALLAPYYLAD